MGRGQELDVGADLHVVADPDGGHVQQDDPEVDEAPSPDVGLVAVVAVQGRADLGALPYRAQQLLQQGPPRVGVGGVAGAELAGEGERPQVVGGQLGIVGDVELTGEHPVALAAPIWRFWCLVTHGRTVPIGSNTSPTASASHTVSLGPLGS
jgi:hypothetical protein